MNNETKNVFIHLGIMICVTIFFMIYFGAVEKNQELQKQIDENISAVPIGQLLAYEGYLAYVLLRIIRRIQEKIKLERTRKNALVLGGKLFYEYTTWIVDLIAITVITFGFFIYGYPDASPDAIEMMKVSDLLFISVLPGLAIISHLLLRGYKLEKRMIVHNHKKKE